MKKKLQVGIASLAMIGLMVSCSTSNDVASKRSIQKRKYNKGFFIDFNKKELGNTKQDEIVSNDTPVVNENKEVENKGITKEILYVEEVQTVVASPADQVAVFEKEEATTSNKTNNVATKTENAITERSRLTIKDVRSIKKEMKSVVKATKKDAKKQSNSSDDMTILYWVLAFFVPFLAVGLVTDWDVKQVVINILLTMLCGIPGIIHAFIVVSRNV